MPIIELQDGRRLEFANTPTPEDVDFAVSQLDTQAQTGDPSVSPPTPAAQQFFSKAEFAPPPSIDNGLSIGQNLLLGFAANDRQRLQFLQEEFKNDKVELDPEKGITINGRRINPQGFDFGDVLRNLGFVLPVAGQIAGGTLGLAAEIPSGPVPTTIAMGVGGALVGETGRLAIGKLFGLDADLAEDTGALAREGMFALGGEVAGRAIGVGARAARASSLGQRLAAFWGRTIKKLNKFGPATRNKVIQFVGAVDPNSVGYSALKKFQNLITKNFDEFRSSNITSKLLFGRHVDKAGRESFLSPLARRVGNIFKIQGGTIDLATTMHKLKNNTFNQFVKLMTNLSDETINTFNKYGGKDLFNKVNMSEGFSSRVANQLTDAVQNRLKNVSRAINRKIKITPKSRSFNTTDLGKRLDRVLKDLGVTSKTTVKNFNPQAPIDFKGAKDLVKLKNLMGSTTSSKKLLGRALAEGEEAPFLFFGQRVPKGFRGGGRFTNRLSKGQAIKLRNSIENIADNILDNPQVGGRTKEVVRNFMSDWRPRFADAFDVVDENRAFTSLKGMMEKTALEAADPELALSSSIRRFRAADPTVKQRVLGVLDELDGAGGVYARDAAKIRKNIDIASAMDEVRVSNGFNIEEGFSKIRATLDDPNIINPNASAQNEGLFRQVDEIFKRSKDPNLRNRAFMDDAMDAVAAKGFKAAKANALRVGAITNTLGGGALGTMVGGPIGGVVGLGVGLTLSDPQVIAKILLKTQGKIGTPAQRQAIKKVIEKSGRVAQRAVKEAEPAGPAVTGRILRSILGQ